MKNIFLSIALMFATASAFATVQIKTTQDKPWRVFLVSDAQNLEATTDHNDSAHYLGTSHRNINPLVTIACDTINENWTWVHYDHAWVSGIGGAGSEYNNWRNYHWDSMTGGTNTAGGMTGNMAWDWSGWGEETGTYDNGIATTGFTNTLWIWNKIGNEHCNVTDPVKTNWTYVTNNYEYSGFQHDTYTRTADTVWHVQTGGKAVPGLLNLCQFSGSAWEILNKRAVPQFGGVSMNEITNKPDIVIGSMGNLFTNGVRYNLLPNDAEFDVTPKVAGKDFYTFIVGGQKYLSYFDVYVLEGNPGGFSPIGEYDEGHAWWGLRTEAPQDALNYISPTNRWFLAQGTYGYEPTTYTLPGCLWCPGQLEVPESHRSYNVKRSFYIGFNNLINAIEFTHGLRSSPGTYVAPGHNCVQVVRDAAASAGGESLKVSIWPQYFGMMISLMYPDGNITYSHVFLP